MCTAAGGLLGVPLAGVAQQAARKIARIAIISPGTSEMRSVFTVFRAQLRALGYEEGRDIVLAFYLAQGSEGLAYLGRNDLGGACRHSPCGRPFGGARDERSEQHHPDRRGDRRARGRRIGGEPRAPGGNVTGVATMAVELVPKQTRIHARDSSRRRAASGVVEAGDARPALPITRSRSGRLRLGLFLRRIVIRAKVNAESELVAARSAT